MTHRPTTSATDTTARPEAILDRAADVAAGITLRFTDESGRNSYKTRLVRARHKVCYANAEPHPWDDLVIRAPGSTELWIGPPSMENFGITAITEEPAP